MLACSLIAKKLCVGCLLQTEGTISGIFFAKRGYVPIEPQG
jgi:hypothetical protein